MHSGEARQRPDRGLIGVLLRRGSTRRGIGRAALLSGWLVLAHGCSSRQEDDATHTAVVRAYVAGFYDSYLADRPEVVPGPPAWVSVASGVPPALTPELAEALAADWRATEMSPGEIVELDFDPFLASQDPCDAYRLGNVVAKEGRYHVEVFGECGGRGRQVVPDVIAEVVRRQDRYVFANFHYPADSANLVAVLRLMREGRR